MEKSLIEKMLSGTTDEVDDEMIKSRLWYCSSTLDKLVHDFVEGLDKLTKEHTDELKLLGAGFVLLYSDRLFRLAEPGKHVEASVVFGSKPELKEMIVHSSIPEILE